MVELELQLLLHPLLVLVPIVAAQPVGNAQGGVLRRRADRRRRIEAVAVLQVVCQGFAVRPSDPNTLVDAYPRCFLAQAEALLT